MRSGSRILAATRLLVVAAVAVLAVAGCGQDGQAPAAAPPASSASSAPADATGSAGLGSSGPSASAAPSSPAAATVAIPAGVTAGIVVFDRQANSYVLQQKGSWRFRSASLVKLLIALDYFWAKGPAYEVPAAERPKLEIMLRSSDDAAATGLWKANGQRDIVTRMVQRLGLQDTAPPPAAQPGYWGYTAVSAADLVRIYQYVLGKAPAPVREFIMGNLHATTKCGTDHYDQSFGIPSVFKAPRAAKQGWSGFGDNPATPCAAGVAMPARYLAPNNPDMSGEVLHTTGTVGENDRYIVAVLSVHPDGSRFSTAAANLTKIAKALPLPASTKL